MTTYPPFRLRLFVASAVAARKDANRGEDDWSGNRKAR